MSKLVRVLHVVHSLNDGGIERLLLEICKKIDRNRFEIQICCLNDKGKLANEFEKLNIKLHLLNAKRNIGVGSIITNIQKIFELRKIIKNENITITHGHEFYSTVFSRISGLISGVKHRYITLHNMYYWWNWAVHFTQYVLSFITTKIVCNSYSTLKYSLANDKINRNKYVVIYNGIDCDKFSMKLINKDMFLKGLNLPIRDPIFVSVGVVTSRKGFQYSINAIECLRKEFGNMLYLIVGGQHHLDFDEYEKIMKIIKDNSLEEIVFVTGRRNDVENFLSLCDVYLMPSVVEGFGISLVEALAMEKIVIASDIEPFKEIIEDGINGFLFKSGDHISLANKIREVTKLDTKTLNIIRKNAREKILAEFNAIKMVTEYSNLYLGYYNK